MENKNNSETLEDEDSNVVCNSSELGDLRSKDSMMFDFVTENSNVEKGGSFDDYPGDKSFVATDNEKVENNDVPVFEGELKFSWSDEMIQVDKPGEKNDGLLHCHDPSSPTTLGVTSTGIDLLVEVFGPLDGIYDSNKDDESDTAIHEDGNIECKFKVGDLIWVKKARTEIWWPGMICDPSNASKGAIDSQESGSISYLVKYFGNASFVVWCLDSDVKPFIECFQEMYGQNISKSFFGAVEKALSVIGDHVKSTLTCPCSLKKCQTVLSSEDKDRSLTSTENINTFDVFSLSQFEPSSLVSCIRNLATGTASVPDKIKLTVVKNCITTYYRSIGHCQLPLRLLRQHCDDVQSNVLGESLEKGCDDNILSPKREKRSRVKDSSPVLANTVTSSGTKGFESRERKKSKYLSYPYVDAKNVAKDASTLEEEKQNPKDVSSITVKSTPEDTKSRKRGSKKPSKVNHIMNKGDNIDACSRELLNELRSSALDCCYLNKSKYSDSLTRFYCSFRIFSFLDAEIVDQKVTDKKEPSGKVKESVKQKVNSGSDIMQAKRKETCKMRSKKKKEEVKVGGLESVVITPSKQSVISLQQSCSDLPKCQTTPEKRNEGTTQGLPHNDSNGLLQNDSLGVSQNDSIFKPDMKGHEAGFLVEKPLMEGLASSINVIDKVTAFASVSSLEGVGVNETSQSWSAGVISKESEANMIKFGHNSSVQNSVETGILPPPGFCKERKREETTSEIPSVIPDLKGNVSDPNSLMNPASADGKPQLKRMRNSKANKNEESGAKVKIRKVVEDLGGGLILNFAPNIPLPPRETLVSTFSKFGLLKETQVQILNDSSAEILYQRSPDARFAYRSMEKVNPFGAAVVSFKLNGVPLAPKIKKKRKITQVPNPSVPENVAKPKEAPENVAKPKEAMDLATMLKKMETMKQTLDKASNVSPEMRAMLEKEIQGFMNKFGNVGGSSSSSS